MQIVFLKGAQESGAWAKAAWEVVETLPGERRTIESPGEVESLSMWRVGCMVGLLDSAEPNRLVDFIRAVRMRDGGPDVPIIVCGSFEAEGRGLQWAHANGADDFLSTQEPAARLLKRVETFAGVSGEPTPVDRSEIQRKIIRSLQVASERKQHLESAEQRQAVESGAGAHAESPAAIVTKNVIAIQGLAFVAQTLPKGFAHTSVSAPATEDLQRQDAKAQGRKDREDASSLRASASLRLSPSSAPASALQDDHAAWLRNRLVEIREADYFSILRVSRTASGDEIRAAFDAATRECEKYAAAFGDTLAGPLSEVRAGIEEAFGVLGDAALCTAYREGIESS